MITIFLRGEDMYCKICGENREVLHIFSINMCKECFSEIAFSDVNETIYESYKNLIRILLSYYLEGKQIYV